MLPLRLGASRRADRNLLTYPSRFDEENLGHARPPESTAVKRGTAYAITAAEAPNRASISYINDAGRRRTLRPSPELLHEPIVRAQPSRRPATHPLRRNTEGFYWFEQTAHHVWHESMVEYTALMLLDHSADISGICTQPMRIDFEDGTAHFPDIFLTYASGVQEVCNVRPADLIDDAAREQFWKTEALCDRVGWRHRVIVDLSLTQRQNLELLAAYRHPRNMPDDDVADTLLDVLNGEAPFGMLWEACQRHPDPYALAGLYNLLWHRDIVFDMSSPLEMNTMLWRI